MGRHGVGGRGGRRSRQRTREMRGGARAERRGKLQMARRAPDMSVQARLVGLLADLQGLREAEQSLKACCSSVVRPIPGLYCVGWWSWGIARLLNVAVVVRCDFLVGSAGAHH